MSFEEVQPYYSDNQEDYMYPYCFMDHQEEQDLSFPEEYLKNVSDCSKSQTKNSNFDVFPTSKTLQVNKIQQNINCMQSLLEKETEKIDADRFTQQSSPSTKVSEKTVKPLSEDEEKSKKISKKKYAKKMEIVLNYDERLQQRREIKIQRYKEKKYLRNWNRGILYEERKKLACRRQRIQGRFQGKSEEMLKLDEQKNLTNKIWK